jgi:hypothetical protein
MSDITAGGDRQPPEGLVEGLLALIGLTLDERRTEPLRRALADAPAGLALLREAAAGEEPQVVFDPRWS